VTLSETLGVLLEVDAKGLSVNVVSRLMARWPMTTPVETGVIVGSALCLLAYRWQP
jgi:hypothetical protein